MERWPLNKSLIAVVLMWMGAIGMSMLGFHHTYGALPALADALTGGMVLGGIALPLSFAQALGARVPLDNAVFLAAGYWPVLLYAHYQFLARRRPQLFAALVILVALSAWRWQINVQSLMG